MADLAAIHEAALSILRTVGVAIDHEHARAALASAGCDVSESRVRIPPLAVERALAAMPRQWNLRGEAGQAVCIGYERMACMNAGVFPWISDLDTAEPRRATLADVAATTRLLDRLAQVDLVFATLVDATDLAGDDKTPRTLEAVLASTTKPLVGPGVANRAEAEAVVAMLGRADRAAPFVCATAPLRYDRGAVDALVTLADAGFAVDLVTNPVMGLTAPFTLAATVALGHAELLAGIVLAQTLAPGLRILTQNTPTVVDLQAIVSTSGGPEVGLMRRAVAQLGRRLGIPTHVSGHTSSWSLDPQACDEKTLNQALIVEAGPSILAGLGALGNAMITSYEAMVLDDERFAALRRVRQGVAVDDDHLAVDAVAEGVEAGQFLTLDHTLRHMQSGEVWRPRLARRDATAPPRDGDALLKRARDKARQLMAQATGAPTPRRCDTSR